MELYQRDVLTGSGGWRTEWVPVPTPIPLRRVVRSALLNALAYTDGDQARAAGLLGLTPRTLNYQLQVHDIPRAHAAPRHLRRRIQES